MKRRRNRPKNGSESRLRHFFSGIVGGTGGGAITFEWSMHLSQHMWVGDFFFEDSIAQLVPNMSIYRSGLKSWHLCNGDRGNRRLSRKFQVMNSRLGQCVADFFV